MNRTVLVVGAGPVGLTMAAELARYGISVRIVDKMPARTDKSKALVLWSRSLELIERMGCVRDFVDAGIRVAAANVVTGGRRIGRIGFEGIASPYPYALMLPQCETERLMAAHLGSFGVAVERGVELVAFHPAADQVAVELQHPDGRIETAAPGWLIGCDGAHSTVRHGLGLDFAGSTLPSDWILADVHLAGVPTPPDELDLYWHRDGVLAFFPIGPNRFRVLADVGPPPESGHRADPTLAEVQAIVDDRGPGGVTASDPVWLSTFRINERKVENYRAGRVFLAGDAAHIHSPAGGQGMNTGIQDACNLAWKLAIVAGGACASEALLDSYSAERSPIGTQVLAATGRLTALATLHNPVAQTLRNGVASLLFGLSPVKRAMAENMTEISIGYPDGPLTLAPHTAKGGPTPGARALAGPGEPPIGSGDRPRFALFAESDDACTRVIGRYAEILEPAPRPPFAPDGIWLVRPDGYVAAAVRAGEWDAIGTYLESFRDGADPTMEA